LRANAAALFASHRRLESNLSAKRRRALLEAPRGWVKFRDANCSFYSDPDGAGPRFQAAGIDFCRREPIVQKELRNLIR
jgi:uncharacterized protein YecT (DUF1311 family)